MTYQMARQEGARLAEIVEAMGGPVHSSAGNPNHGDPATFVSTFSLTAEKRARLAGLNDFRRGHEVGLLLYAHLCNETCRIRHVAILSSAADRALQRFWELNGQDLVAKTLGAFFGEPQISGDTLEALAARAVEAAGALRIAPDEVWNAANAAAYDARHSFRRRFFAVTGLEPGQLSQLQLEGVL